MHRRDFMRVTAGLAAASFAGNSSAFAQSDYPSSPIRLVVPYPPGGVVDVVARTWADKVKAIAGNVFVDNVGGGGGTIGASNVARAKADGYSLLFGETSCLVIAPSLMLNPPYDAAKDFAPVSLVATSSTSIVVHPSVPANNLAEFIAYAKANPGKLTYGSSGVGTVTHLAGELFKQLAGVDILHVPYRGVGPAMIDAVAGTINVVTPNITSQVLEFHKSGKLRILAIFAPNRISSAPDIPVASEILPGMVMQLTAGVVAPASTPDTVIAKLAEAAGKVSRDPSFQKTLENAGMEVRLDASPDVAKAFWASERARLLPIMKAAGLKQQ